MSDVLHIQQTLDALKTQMQTYLPAALTSLVGAVTLPAVAVYELTDDSNSARQLPHLAIWAMQNESRPWLSVHSDEVFELVLALTHQAVLESVEGAISVGWWYTRALNLALTRIINGRIVSGLYFHESIREAVVIDARDRNRRQSTLRAQCWLRTTQGAS